MAKYWELKKSSHIRARHLRYLKSDEYLIFKHIHLARVKPQNQTKFLGDLKLNFLPAGMFALR